MDMCVARLQGVALSVVVMATLSGCVTAERQLPEFDAAKYGMGSCPTNFRDRCAAIAGKTFMSYGPLQVEYHAPDGRAFLWVGYRIVQGYWRVMPGMFRGRLCYEYAATTNCDGDITKGDPGRQSRQGDPYNLSSRAGPPFNLNQLNFRSNLDDVDRLNAARSSTN